MRAVTCDVAAMPGLRIGSRLPPSLDVGELPRPGAGVVHLRSGLHDNSLPRATSSKLGPEKKNGGAEPPVGPTPPVLEMTQAL